MGLFLGGGREWQGFSAEKVGIRRLQASLVSSDQWPFCIAQSLPLSIYIYVFPHQVRSILLTSGTLSPLSSFAAELGVGFPHRLENPHVISPSQIWVGVVPVGPSGHALNASFQTRNSREYREDLGNAVVNYARLVPDGLLVFFPSYSLLESCVDGWRAPAPGGAATVWDRICRHKHPVVEPRDAAQFGLAVQDYQTKLDAPGGAGAVLFAVCRGKASEGIDFSDRAGRAVIITGIPYANKGDAKVSERKGRLEGVCDAVSRYVCVWIVE